MLKDVQSQQFPKEIPVFKRLLSFTNTAIFAELNKELVLETSINWFVPKSATYDNSCQPSLNTVGY